ncbi:MAG: sulfite exporter TauE/SafE family protein [Betaproteobacteria bacterium]|nr:sulfite exporter TauE/SafE family protein [Betaproteobacteria bacterium]
MTETQILELAGIFFVVAVFYSTVGHAGASGYLASMALVGVAPEVMRPVALTLNIAVAAFTTLRFRHARFFNAKVVGSFLLGSVPLAFVGGGIKLPSQWYQVLVGVVLICSATYLSWRAFTDQDKRAEIDVRVPLVASPFVGAGIGLLSGLTGTGGGIFLSPFILLMGWAGPKATAGISAPFIMANSIAGLAGGIIQGSFSFAAVPNAALPLTASALAGAVVGTWLGIYKLPNRWLIVTLAFVMSVAAVKLIGAAH